MAVESAAPDLRSVHTDTLPKLLHRLGVTLAVSTYQAGKVFLVRADDAVANTHFQALNVPMGMAHDRGRLAVGTKSGVWEFHNQPAVAKRIDASGRTDACFLPRYHMVTGNIAIHEIAYSADELWAVNTRFSCLCTFDGVHSFVPRWRPPFISSYSPDDRCHLNGLCVVDGTPRYVTALGTSDVGGGWRPNKARGGVLLEVPSGRAVASGLSMPHSPRAYDGSLWVLESGVGSLTRVDSATGRLTVVAMLPGFTRGLDFYGPFAFVGLSQVRETAVFSGLPITERLPEAERKCGVWVVDVRNGKTVAFLRFESGVQEVFGVTVLPDTRWPELLTDPADEVVSSSYVLPDAALAEVADPGTQAPTP
jgi:uncharacterized protein (TIGR03032 family)